jgi:hypothetical protein
MVAARKIKRERPDAFTGPHSYGNAIADAIHHAILPLDRVATEMESYWGCDRLPSLVAPSTALRFGSAKAKLDAAITANDPGAVADRAVVLIKGWRVMDAEAKKAGHEALDPEVWTHTTGDGFRIAVARANADAVKAIRTDPKMEGIPVFSLDEVARIVESMETVTSAKKVWPEAVVRRISKKPDEPLNDELPF